MELPKFEGTLDPMVVETRIMQLEEIFKLIRCSEEQKVFFATFMLKWEVKHWWRATKDTLPFKEEDPITWQSFLETFCDNYFSKSVRDEKEVEFLELTQGSITVLH